MRYKFRGLLLMITAVVLVARMALPVFAQEPTGSIRGTVKDEQGAVIQNASITVTRKATGDTRKANAGSDGIYLVTTLLPGEYEVKVEAQGFAAYIISVTVVTGSTTSADASLRVGAANEIVDVVAEAPIIDKQNFKIDGVITRQKIDALPLNGRNFLQLALLEPGVSVSVSNLGNANNLFNVSIGGGDSSLTRITVDGGSVLDPVTGGAAQNFSTESIQEFQISTFSFDLSTGTTSVGAVNIVSRTGTNDFHGNGFVFYRDDQLAAVPTFFRNPFDPAPEFRRAQYGGSLGGPIKKDRAFFFGNVEFLDQDAAISVVNTGAPILSQFNTTFNSPYSGYLFNVRGDVKLNDKNNLFARFSRDKNDAFAPNGTNRMPSNWRDNRNRDNNIQGGVTTIFTQNIVNDARFNYQRIDNTSDPPDEGDCPSSNPACIGARGVQVLIVNSNFTIGNETSAPQNRILDRYQTTDNVNWQKGSHRVRFGGEWEHNYGKGSWDFFNPAIMVLHDPRDVLAVNGAVNAFLPAPLRPIFTIPLPAQFIAGSGTLTLSDILQLPIAAGAVGVGDKVQPPTFNQSIARQGNRYRFYAQDSWQIRRGFTFSFGASYLYETNLLNHDLAKPELLRPLLGNLGKAPKDSNNIAPSLGFAWDVKNDGKTVIRGGAGMYYETVLFVTRLLERPLVGPAGDGRLSIPTAFFRNTIVYPGPVPLPPALAFLNLVNPPVGAGIDFRTIPTKFTGQNLLDHLAVQVPALQAALRAGAGRGLTSIDFVKSAALPATLLDSNLESPYSVQFTFGFQRQLPGNMALSADFVLRNRVHVTSGFGNAIDLNLFNRPAARGGPVIPKCVGAQAGDPTAKCSNGPIQVFQSIDRNSYKALLVKVDKRFSNRYQFTASYALSSLRGYFITENLADWFANPGPLGGDSRHRLTFSGIVNLPWDMQASLIAIYASRGPFNARVRGTVDVNGDGIGGDTLPGLKINELGRSVSREDLFQLVTQFNDRFATPSGGAIAPLVLPAKFEFGDDFHSHDIRLTKTFRVKERVSIQALFEVFNLLNISNLAGYGTTVNSNFGQPTVRVGQAFGTGGPRAIQLGGRVTF